MKLQQFLKESTDQFIINATKHGNFIYNYNDDAELTSAFLCRNVIDKIKLPKGYIHSTAVLYNQATKKFNKKLSHIETPFNRKPKEYIDGFLENIDTAMFGFKFMVIELPYRSFKNFQPKQMQLKLKQYFQMFNSEVYINKDSQSYNIVLYKTSISLESALKPLFDKFKLEYDVDHLMMNLSILLTTRNAKLLKWNAIDLGTDINDVEDLDNEEDESESDLAQAEFERIEKKKTNTIKNLGYKAKDLKNSIIMQKILIDPNEDLLDYINNNKTFSPNEHTFVVEDFDGFDEILNEDVDIDLNLDGNDESKIFTLNFNSPTLLDDIKEHADNIGIQSGLIYSKLISNYSNKLKEKYHDVYGVIKLEEFSIEEEYVDTIVSYTDNSDVYNKTLLNKYNDVDQKIKNYVKPMDDAFNHVNMTLPENIILYRGFDQVPFDVFSSFIKTRQIYMPFYTSTSILPSVGRSFSGIGGLVSELRPSSFKDIESIIDQADSDELDYTFFIFMSITGVNNTQVVIPYSDSSFSDEYEVIINRNTMLKIDEIYDIKIDETDNDLRFIGIHIGVSVVKQSLNESINHGIMLTHFLEEGKKMTKKKQDKKVKKNIGKSIAYSGKLPPEDDIQMTDKQKRKFTSYMYD